MSYHQPVMVTECIDGLRINPTGTYVDVTFGGGGHSMAILEQLKGGKLFAFDQDEDAKIQSEKIHHPSLIFFQANFRHMKRYLQQYGVRSVDGVLADLGISSWQIDSPARGFSTRYNGPLDMRMNSRGSRTAASILNDYDEPHLHKIFGMYGEIRNAKTLATRIGRQRGMKRFSHITDLIEVLKPMAPRGKEFKYYAQVFQALRIEVNEELVALEEFLLQTAEVIVPGGRLVVMAYHSLEDRMVKNYLQTGKAVGDVEKDFYGNKMKPFQSLTKRPIEATEAEIKKNSRARSAKLRIAERMETDSTNDANK